MSVQRDATRPADTSTGAPTSPVPSPTAFNNVNPTADHLGQATSPPDRAAFRLITGQDRREARRARLGITLTNE